MFTNGRFNSATNRMPRFAGLRRWWLVVALTGLHAWAAAQAGIAGAWSTEGGESKVQITTSGDALSGKLVWLKAAGSGGQPPLDVHNPDPALRDKPLLGTTILAGFKRAADGTWKGGTVYAPRSGKHYPAELTLLPDGRLQLKVGAGLVSKTEVWTR